MKCCAPMKLKFTDIEHKLQKDLIVELDTCLVGGHYCNGKDERRICQIKESFEKNIQNERLSVLQWEILSSAIENTISNPPIRLGNIINNYENMDLITLN